MTILPPPPPLRPLSPHLQKMLLYPLCALAVLLVGYVLASFFIYPPLLANNTDLVVPFRTWNVMSTVYVLRWAAIAAFLYVGVVAFFVWKRRRQAPLMLQIASVVIYLLAAAYFYVVIQAVNLIREDGLRMGDWIPSFGEGYWLKICYTFWATVATAAAIWLHVLARRVEVMAWFGVVRPPKVQQRFGGDSFLRKTVILSFVFHFLALVILPWLLQGGGCVNPYRVPGGGGGGGMQQPEIVKVVAKKKPPAKRKTYMLRMNSAISFFVPNIDDSDVGKDVEKVTENTYVATGAGQQSGHGTGKGKGRGFGKGNGRGGGWAGGSADSLVRFIRLQHSGPNWDEGMDNATRSDLNFLEALRDESGKNGSEPFKVANKTEAIAPRLLKEFRKGEAPPFVYMTGNGAIGGISSADIKIMRQYCLDGGMIFADAGSAHFGQSFRQLMYQIFPDHPLVDIPNDDAIFGGGDSALQSPFLFPNGAPPLWHHDGSRAMGVKDDQGHWMVFYFPGDLKDAWKTGHYGVSKDVSAQAFKMGFNVLYYAFTYYTERYDPSNKEK